MDTPFAITFALLGTLGGFVYAGTGLAALKYLSGSNEVDRTVGWTLWWWAASDRYDAEGKRLCRRGAWLFWFAAVCWILAVYFSKQRW